MALLAASFAKQLTIIDKEKMGDHRAASTHAYTTQLLISSSIINE